MTGRLAAVVLFVVLGSAAGRGQGPLLSYLTDPSTALPWASCDVYFDGGSKQRVPFLPVVGSGDRAPLGSRGYTADIRVDAPLVFAGDGSAGAYGTVDAAGKAVLLTFDFAVDAAAGAAAGPTLEARIREAAARRAAAVIAFSTREETPFPLFREAAGQPRPDIPAIVVGRRAADVLFAAAGLNLATVLDEWRAKSAVAPRELIVRAALRIDGAFARIDGDHFTMTFENSIERSARERLAGANEKSVVFAVNLFRDAGTTWRKSRVTYFRNFDSKVFYTHHWGRGLSSGAGIFSVFDAGGADFGLAVHENTHTLLGDNWGETSSFMTEGLARYAESAATDAVRDHRQTSAFGREGRLFPLAEMVTIDIGADPRTEVAYPAAGSFVTYLIAIYGLGPVREAYRLEAREHAAKARQESWTIAFKKPLVQLEADWLEWLRTRIP